MIFGRYQFVQELHRTGLTQVYNARLASDVPPDPELPQEQPGTDQHKPAVKAPPAPFVIKVLRPAIELLTADALRQLSESFLERATAQQQAAALPNSHWAPIHELGRSETDAFYVTDYFGRSAQKLISHRVKINGDELFNIIDSVFQGLSELQSSGSRSHANLKPSNALIEEKGELDSARVVLSDPAALGDVLTRGGEAADLRSVGELIYQLVMFKPSEPHVWPIPRTGEWSRLGASARPWRELCSRLLSPDPGEMTLADAHQQLRSSRGRQRTVVRGAVAAIVVAGVLAAIWSGLSYARLQRQWTEHKTAYTTWFQPLVEHLKNNDAMEAAYNGDDDFKAIFRDMSKDDVELIPPRIISPQASRSDSPPDRAPLRLDVIKRTSAAHDRLQSIDRALATWPLLLRWDKQREDAAAQNQPIAAGYLKVVIDDAKSRQNGEALGRAIDCLLFLSTPEGTREWETLKDLSAQLEKQRVALKDTGSPLLAQFGQRIQQASDDAMTGNAQERGRGLTAMNARLSVYQEQGKRVADFVASTWNQPDRFDKQRFLSETGATTRADQAYETQLAQWIESSRDYEVKADQGKQMLDPLDRALEQVRADLTRIRATLPKGQSLEASYDNRLADIGRKVQALHERKWIVKDLRTRPQVMVEADEELRKLNGNLQQEITKFGDPGEWLASTATIGLAHAELQAQYKRWRDATLQGHSAEELSKSIETYVALKRRVDAWRDLFTKLDRTLPPPPTASTDSSNPVATSLAQVRRQKYDEMVTASLQAVAEKDGLPSLDERHLGDAVATYQSTSDDIAALEKDCRALMAALDGGYGLNEAPPDGTPPAQWEEKWKKSPLTSDPAVASALAPLFQRLSRLREAESWKSADAMARLRDSKQLEPEIAVAALRRALSGEPPATLVDFNNEAKMRGELDALLERCVPSPAHRQTLHAQLQSDAPRRWEVFLNDFNNPALLKDAIEAAVQGSRAFNVADQSKLKPWVQYNLALRRYRQRADDPSARADVLAEDLRKELKRIGDSGEGFNRELAAALDRSLQRIGEPATSGPRAPWRVAAGGDGSELQFTLQSGASAAELKFVRIDAPDTSPFYLCTTEVSIGLFRDEANRNGDVRQVMPPPFTDASDPRSGPRGWHWDGNQIDRPRPPIWLPNTGFPSYPPQLAAENYPAGLKSLQDDPSVSHPVQQISPLVAMKLADALGCRLPAPDEFAAAYKAFGGNNVEANVRDRTWKLQWEYAVRGNELNDRVRAILRPDAGIFMPESVKSEAGRAYDIDDKKLFFFKVDTGGGQIVHHLRGNVAEYLRDPVSGKFFVAGGSALSAPEMDPAIPYPLPAGADDNRNTAYSDVGLRLAFDDPKTTPVVRFKSLLARQPLMLPPKR